MPREKTKVVQKRRAKRAFWPSDGEQCGEAADQAKKLVFFAQGRADLRAADRSADERSEAEAPKKSKAVCPQKIIFS